MYGFLTLMIVALLSFGCGSSKRSKSVDGDVTPRPVKPLNDQNVTKNPVNKPKPKPQVRPEPQPEPKPQPQPEPKPQPQPEPKPQPQPEPKPQPQPEPKPQPQPEPKPQPLWLDAPSVHGASDFSSAVFSLWDYMVPSQSIKKRFIVHKGSVADTKYVQESLLTDVSVELSSDALANEKTVYVYEHGTPYLSVSFQKDNIANGTYLLYKKVRAHATVSKRNSSCHLENHYDKFSIIKGKVFDDVIEIRCAHSTGYYQKGMGEIAQVSGDEKHAFIEKVAQ